MLSDMPNADDGQHCNPSIAKDLCQEAAALSTRDTVELSKEDRKYRPNRQMHDFPTYSTRLDRSGYILLQRLPILF